MSYEKPQKVVMDTVYSLADLRDILNGLTLSNYLQPRWNTTGTTSTSIFILKLVITALTGGTENERRKSRRGINPRP